MRNTHRAWIFLANLAVLLSFRVALSDIPAKEDSGAPPPVTEAELVRFHGHLGPFVVLGAKMGELAIGQHHIPRYFGLTVEVQGPISPPRSCLVDGLQWATGATMGKGNIRQTPSEEIRVHFRRDDTGAGITVRLSAEATELLKAWEAESVEVEDRGRRLLSIPAAELFKVDIRP
ncbi:MAG: formylmethanofuran dehydrogenase subunit E [Candidatus Omnitrophica bacterium]|nr:hypothetical protein [bacterium]NUN94702.1 formylmethanofuran dehydrogenase subunit E [Candidatus Omnitrophota bacterium]